MSQDILNLKKFYGKLGGEVFIGGSKSESNRWLILNALYNNCLKLNNLSNSDDTRVLVRALQIKNGTADIGYAGTAMRFLTSYFAIQEGREIMLTGSKRMQERPIGILVDALRELGADIACGEKQGYPPLIIRGKKLKHSKVRVQANTSSQFISSLLLIGSSLDGGLDLELVGAITSQPYLQMTIDQLRTAGISIIQEEDRIFVRPSKVLIPKDITIESDWSSASYFFSMIALSEQGELRLNHFSKDGYQGDRKVIDYYCPLGVETRFDGTTLTIKKSNHSVVQEVRYDLNETPDLAQTIAVTCLGLNIPCYLSGLHTLKIKETDRLAVLKTEIEKLGGTIEITDDSLTLKPISGRLKSAVIETYHDHRMALAFAPLAIKSELGIKDPGVVRKSFPEYWDVLKKLGFKR